MSTVSAFAGIPGRVGRVCAEWGLDTLQGVSLHQSIGWIESALPSSRFFKEVGLVKQMGANLIRCAHFPRDPSFYNACDELGMLAMVEVPTWGCCLANGWTYPDSPVPAP